MKVIKLPRQFALTIIKVYQLFLSPDHGWLKDKYPHGFCHYYPSCSEYVKQAIERFGLIKGGWMGLKRIIKCNPLTAPKVDNVPNS
jgi:hypothetical protein